MGFRNKVDYAISEMSSDSKKNIKVIEKVLIKFDKSEKSIKRFF